MRAKRELGQHFLESPKVVEAILGACAPLAAPAAAVLEIGPGRGALTGGLLALGKPTFAVEKDIDLLPVLEHRFPGLRVALGDALELDLPHVAMETGLAPWFVAGNLPYNAGTEILRRLLVAPQTCSACVVMLQLEVAQKFCGPSGSSGWGPLGIWSHAWWEGDLLFRVPPGAFAPPPKVTSAVCRFTVRPSPALPSAQSGAYWRFLRRAFAHPRKTLASNLAGGGGSKSEWAERLRSLGLAPGVRPSAVHPVSYEELFEVSTESPSRPRA